jgi:hypothetical protein
MNNSKRTSRMVLQVSKDDIKLVQAAHVSGASS